MVVLAVLVCDCTSTRIVEAKTPLSQFLRLNIHVLQNNGVCGRPCVRLRTLGRIPCVSAHIECCIKRGLHGRRCPRVCVGVCVCVVAQTRFHVDSRHTCVLQKQGISGHASACRQPKHGHRVFMTAAGDFRCDGRYVMLPLYQWMQDAFWGQSSCFRTHMCFADAWDPWSWFCLRCLFVIAHVCVLQNKQPLVILRRSSCDLNIHVLQS